MMRWPSLGVLCKCHTNARAGKLGSSGYEEKAGPKFAECQEGRVQSPGGGLQRKITSPGMKSPGLSPSSALPFPICPLLSKMLRHSVFSFPICKMRPISQPISESKLGRMQGITGQGPFGGQTDHTPFTAPTLPSVTFTKTQNLPVLGSSASWTGLL